MSEHRSQLLNECREKHKTEEKALQDLRWKTNGESEQSFNSEGNSLNKFGLNGKKGSKNGSKLGSQAGSIIGGKQKSDHNDAISFVSFQSDFKSRYSTKTFEDNKMLEIILRAVTTLKCIKSPIHIFGRIKIIRSSRRMSRETILIMISI